MPSAAPRPCTFAGCNKLVHNGSRCDEHRRQVERERGSAHERGYTAAWSKARAGFLRSHPLCVLCAPRVQAASVVDHVVPHKGDMVLFWDHNNWQPLCKPCHDRKTALEDGGFGRQGG